MNRIPFNEARMAEHPDPLFDPVHRFPYEEVFRALDGAASPADWEDDDLNERLALVVRRLLQFAVGTTRRLQPGARERMTGRRLLALAWVLDPGFFDGKSVSELAQELGLSPRVLQKSTAAASKWFGIRNRGQSHAWNFKATPTRT